MRKLIAVLALIVPLSVLATSHLYVADLGDGNKATLKKDACKGKVAVMLGAGAKDAKAATVLWQGRKLEACWVTDGRFVYLADEDGDVGMLPLEMFVPASGV